MRKRLAQTIASAALALAMVVTGVGIGPEGINANKTPAAQAHSSYCGHGSRLLSGSDIEVFAASWTRYPNRHYHSYIHYRYLGYTQIRLHVTTRRCYS